MADNTTTYTLTGAWSSTNRYTAGSETDVLLSNTGTGLMRFATTTDDTAPTLDVAEAHPLQNGQGRAMTLAAGTRLWLAGAGQTAAIEV